MSTRRPTCATRSRWAFDVLQHVGSAGTAPPYSKELITDIVNAGRPVVVTAAHRAWVYEATAEFPERLQDPELKKAFGPEIYAEVQNSLKNWWSLGYFQRTDREMLFRERGVKQFIESGAVMGMGTDSGTPMNFHSEALWREIKVHVDMGMSPMRAIAAATRVNAQRDRQGTRARLDRARQARRHHRRQRQPAVRHHRAVARRDRRQGRHRVQRRPGGDAGVADVEVAQPVRAATRTAALVARPL